MPAGFVAAYIVACLVADPGCHAPVATWGQGSAVEASACHRSLPKAWFPGQGVVHLKVICTQK